MSYHVNGDKSTLEFHCDMKDCKSIEVLTFETNAWTGRDLHERVVKLKGWPIIMPVGWHGDATSQFCHRHDVTYKAATIIGELNVTSPR